MVYRCTVEGFGATLKRAVFDLTDSIGHEVERRSTLVSNELHTASQYVLRGARSGRWYRVPGTYARNGGKKRGRMYQASAPGEPPANRTGVFRASFKGRSYVAAHGAGGSRELHAVCESDYHVGKYLLGELLELGTYRIAPRPYAQPIIDRAMPKIQRIYNSRY